MKEDDLNLKRCQQYWSKSQMQLMQSDYLSKDEICQMIHSNHKPQFFCRRRAKKIQWCVCLLLLFLAMLGENSMLNVGNRNGILLLAVLSVLFLVVLIGLSYELYLMRRIYQLRHHTNQMTPYSERLQRISQHNQQLMRLFVVQRSNVLPHLSWWRVSIATVCMFVVVGMGIFYVEQAHSQQSLVACTIRGDISNPNVLEAAYCNVASCDVERYLGMVEEQLEAATNPMVEEGRML